MQRWSWAWLALAVCWPSETVLAQSRARLSEALVVEPDKSGCITHAALLARVLHWLEPSLEIGDVQVLVRGRARPPSFVVQRGTGSPAERSFDVLPARCRDRVDAMALAIALALEEAARVESAAPTAAAVPDAEDSPLLGTGLELQPGWDDGPSAAPPRVLPGSSAGAGSEPNPSPEADAVAPTPTPDRAPVAPPPDASSSAAVPEAATDAAVHVRLRAGADGMIEALPEPVLGLHAGVELVLEPERRWSLGLDALVTSESETPVSGGRVFARLYMGRAVACFGWPAGDAALEGCAGTALGASAARGEFGSSGETTTLFWASVLARAALRYPREGRVGARLAIDGFANVARPAYRVLGGDTLMAERFGAAASLELIVALE
jgi:hypothetical protein